MREALPISGRRQDLEKVRLLTKVARMYHERGMRQPAIAEALGMSQSRVSRSLKDAGDLGIVRTVVLSPDGVYGHLEDALCERFGLRDAVVVDTADDSEQSVLRALGAGGAGYLERTLTKSDRVGISSWSSTLLAVAESMRPSTVRSAADIVQIIGGVGRPNAQVNATRLTEQFARVTGASPRFLPAPGIVADPSLRDALMEDVHVAELTELWSRLTVALVGIGSLQPSPLLRESGNSLSETELGRLREASAVGDVCLHFFEADGTPQGGTLEGRIVGISSTTLRAIPRVIGIAGGARKVRAIRGAVEGGWVNVLITDITSARALLEDEPPRGPTSIDPALILNQGEL